MEMYIWLFGTAVIFTVVGMYMGSRTKTENIIASTIDSLILEGYLKTRGVGKDMEILKWREWDNGKADRT
jgi:hypothetical protein